MSSGETVRVDSLYEGLSEISEEVRSLTEMLCKNAEMTRTALHWPINRTDLFAAVALSALLHKIQPANVGDYFADVEAIRSTVNAAYLVAVELNMAALRNEGNQPSTWGASPVQ